MSAYEASCRAKPSSLASSPAKKRRFSSSATSPSRRSATTLRAPSPTASSVSNTSLPRSSARRAPTGSSDSPGVTPLGRPRCDASTTRAPRLTACTIVGSDARMRESSATPLAGVSGTLKSTRMKTRLPSIGRSAMDLIMTTRPLLFLAGLQALLRDVLGQLVEAVGVAGLVVVPGHDLGQLADHHRREQVDRRRVVVAVEVDRHQRLVGDREHAHVRRVL